MLESLENLKAALKDLPQENLQALLAEVTASSQGAVAIARDATGAKIVTGSDNILGDNNRVVIHQGMDAETLKLVLQEVLAAQRVYFYGSPETQPQTQAIAQAIREDITKSGPSPPTEVASVDKLVQQVRSRLHDDIQRLHGTMPLWGVDHWMPLGELFVDVNILEEVSSNRRAELADLWQDFSQNPSYRGLDRMGLGKEQQRVSGLEVLARNTNLMVVGKPGSGKTTYLQRVVTECNAGNLQAHRIPVLIRLREFVEDGRGVDYAVERYLEQCWRLSAVEVQLVLDAGRSLVLMDGLDEVTGADGQAIAQQIKRFARAYPQVQIIVTCRTQSQESRFERFDYVEVADFNKPQVRTFAEHWFKAVMGDESAGLAKAQKFLDLLFREENKPIRELAITPILLSLTCTVFQQTGKFYSKRSQLYEEGLELLLEQWDKSREIERDEIYRDLSVERKLELLSYLAVKKFEQEQYVLFEQAEIEGYISEFLGIGLRESRGVLKAIEAQHGLLIERAQKIWSFSHLTLQEYLVAKWFCDQSDWETLVSQITKEHWKEIFSLTSDITQDINNLLQIMKYRIDILLEDEKFQVYLNWLASKADLLLFPYEKSAIRSLVLALALEDPENLVDLPRSLGIDLDFSSLPDTPLEKERLISEFAVDRNLRLVLSFASGNEGLMPSQVRVPIPIVLEQIIENELSYITPRNYELEEAIRQLINKLPDWWLNENVFDHIMIERMDEWWELNGEEWTQELRLNMINYRNFGHDWHFSKNQKVLLQYYWNANKLLVDCLNGRHDISCKLQQDIKDILLLPIAEIEKRNHEKVG
jgi:hypothetical protein